MKTLPRKALALTALALLSLLTGCNMSLGASFEDYETVAPATEFDGIVAPAQPRYPEQPPTHEVSEVQQ